LADQVPKSLSYPPERGYVAFSGAKMLVGLKSKPEHWSLRLQLDAEYTKHAAVAPLSLELAGAESRAV